MQKPKAQTSAGWLAGCLAKGLEYEYEYVGSSIAQVRNDTQ